MRQSGCFDDSWQESPRVAEQNFLTEKSICVASVVCTQPSTVAIQFSIIIHVVRTSIRLGTVLRVVWSMRTDRINSKQVQFPNPELDSCHELVHNFNSQFTLHARRVKIPILYATRRPIVAYTIASCRRCELVFAAFWAYNK